MTTQPVFELARVTRRFADVYALRDLSLAASAGEIIGLVGHNGAGKTTAIKLILGILAPGEGEVRIFGESPTGRNARTLRKSLGYLPERVQLYEHLSGSEVLAWFARLKGAARTEVPSLLERMGLSGHAHRRIATYSKGMRQRLGLAQALLGRPRLLVLDEPTAGLDPMATGCLFDILRELQAQGTAVLFSSHALAGIEQHADRIALLRHGSLAAHGSLEALQRESGLPVRICARGPWPVGFWPSRFAKAISVDESADGEVVITCPTESKLDTMRRLLAETRIDDIEVSSPSLEQVYAHFNRGRYSDD